MSIKFHKMFVISNFCLEFQDMFRYFVIKFFGQNFKKCSHFRKCSRIFEKYSLVLIVRNFMKYSILNFLFINSKNVHGIKFVFQLLWNVPLFKYLMKKISKWSEFELLFRISYLFTNSKNNIFVPIFCFFNFFFTYSKNVPSPIFLSSGIQEIFAHFGNIHSKNVQPNN